MSTLTSLRRTPYQTLGIFFALTFSFFILLVFSFTILFLTKLINYVESQPQVTVYFLKTTPQSAIFKLREQLLMSDKVKQVRFISQEQALAIYKDLNKNEPLLLEMVSKEALPASLEVYTQKPEYLLEVAELAKKEPGVEDVAFQRDVVDNLIKITTGIQWSAAAFLTSQFIIVCFVIFSTIGFKMIAKKEEIETLRLLGAGRFFVTKPLIQENLMINFFATLVAGSAFIGSYLAFKPQINQFLVGIPTLNLYRSGQFSLDVWPPNWYFFASAILGTFILGYLLIFLTTYFAANKYIK